MRRINRNLPARQAVGPATLVAEALLVLGWGAMIPGLLWLGAGAGF